MIFMVLKLVTLTHDSIAGDVVPTKFAKVCPCVHLVPFATEKWSGAPCQISSEIVRLLINL